MSDTNLILMLQLIFAGGDVNALLARGLEFSQIAMLIRDALEKGLIADAEDSLQLTADGLAKMRTSSKGDTVRRDGGWISPLDNVRIEKLGPNDIYLPDRETAVSLTQGH